MPAPSGGFPVTENADLKAAHTPERIRLRLGLPSQHSYLRDFVYGAIDGAVTTFAVVSGVAGAGLSTGVIIVLGLANLVGDGFSMAASNYLGAKADEELRDKARRQEEQHICECPEGEREEIRQIFAKKGFAAEELEHVVDVITGDRKRWVDTMLVEELGLPLEGPSPIRAAAVTMLAFVSVGLIPLAAFISDYLMPGSFSWPYLGSTLLTGAAFFSVGATKSLFTDAGWLRSGLETFIIGGAAAGLAYAVGLLLSGIAV